MARGKGKEGSSDDEWTPPPTQKPKPKNFALTAARLKKQKQKGKTDIRCNECGKRCTDRVQLKNHRKTHGSYLDTFMTSIHENVINA